MAPRRAGRDALVTLRLLVEGGGDSKALHTSCRRGFRKLIEKAGLAGSMPKIVAKGSRGEAFRSFRRSPSGGGIDLLLVDSEGPVKDDDPWEHLAQREGDKWQRPSSAGAEQCHLMVQVMESWFLADRKALKSYFGQGFAEGTLPKQSQIEQAPKADVLRGLMQAARHTKKKGYSKGSDAFEILANIDPAKVRRASHWAERFFSTLEKLSKR